MKRVLTIAGSDSGGGAGIQADLKTITVLGAFGTCAVTALTAQDTTGVKDILPIPPDFVGRQVTLVLSDIGADAVKTGMLGSADTVSVVADILGQFPDIPLVVDPVGTAKGGAVLLDCPGRDALARRLLPLALLVTPNLPEAADLSGRPVESLADMREAARRIRGLGPRWVLVKGGHLRGDPVDILLGDDGFWEFPGPRLPGRNTHGTGCTLSAAIATFLARGLTVPDAVAEARQFLVRAIEAGVSLGAGHGSLGHLAAASGMR